MPGAAPEINQGKPRPPRQERGPLAEGGKEGPPKPAGLTADQIAAIRGGQARGNIDKQVHGLAFDVGQRFSDLEMAARSGNPDEIAAAQARAAELLAKLEAQAGALGADVSALMEVANDSGVNVPPAEPASGVDPHAPTELKELKRVTAARVSPEGQPAPSVPPQEGQPRGSATELKAWEEEFMAGQPAALEKARQGEFNVPITVREAPARSAENVIGPVALVSPERVDATRERLPWEETPAPPAAPPSGPEKRGAPAVRELKGKAVEFASQIHTVRERVKQSLAQYGIELTGQETAREERNKMMFEHLDEELKGIDVAAITDSKIYDKLIQEGKLKFRESGDWSSLGILKDKFEAVVDALERGDTGEVTRLLGLLEQTRTIQRSQTGEQKKKISREKQPNVAELSKIQTAAQLQKDVAEFISAVRSEARNKSAIEIQNQLMQESVKGSDDADTLAAKWVQSYAQDFRERVMKDPEVLNAIDEGRIEDVMRLSSALLYKQSTEVPAGDLTGGKIYDSMGDMQEQRSATSGFQGEQRMGPEDIEVILTEEDLRAVQRRISNNIGQIRAGRAGGMLESVKSDFWIALEVAQSDLDKMKDALKMNPEFRSEEWNQFIKHTEGEITHFRGERRLKFPNEKLPEAPVSIAH